MKRLPVMLNRFLLRRRGAEGRIVCRKVVGSNTDHLSACSLKRLLTREDDPPLERRSKTARKIAVEPINRLTPDRIVVDLVQGSAKLITSCSNLRRQIGIHDPERQFRLRHPFEQINLSPYVVFGHIEIEQLRIVS